MSPHRARELRVEMLRRAVEDKARHAARLVNEAKVAGDASPEDILAACGPRIAAAALELGRALLDLDKYSRGEVRP